MVGHDQPLDPNVADETVAHDRARRLLLRSHSRSQKELSLEVSALIKAQQLQWYLVEAKHPT